MHSVNILDITSPVEGELADASYGRVSPVNQAEPVAVVLDFIYLIDQV